LGTAQECGDLESTKQYLEIDTTIPSTSSTRDVDGDGAKK